MVGCDGMVWHGEAPLCGEIKTVKQLKDRFLFE